MSLSHNDTSNGFLAAISAVPAYWAAFIEPSTLALVSAIVLPCFFFFVGKAIDIAVKIYFERKDKP